MGGIVAHATDQDGSVLGLDIILAAGLVAGAVALYLGGVETRGRTLEKITTVVPAADRAVGA